MLAVALAALLPAGCAPAARPAPVRPAARPIAAEAVLTARCVSLPVADLLRVLRWLDPAAEPRIVMAPRQALGRY